MVRGVAYGNQPPVLARVIEFKPAPEINLLSRMRLHKNQKRTTLLISPLISRLVLTELLLGGCGIQLSPQKQVWKMIIRARMGEIVLSVYPPRRRKRFPAGGVNISGALKRLEGIELSRQLVEGYL
ncbi:MAG: hypothetical protein ACJ74Z_22505 [Bryobacteraceae bacterium]